jgi:hypothetical protein
MLNWHTSVLNLESAAYILSLGVRQAFWAFRPSQDHSGSSGDYMNRSSSDSHGGASDGDGSSFDVSGLYLHLQFLSAFLGSWNQARRWAPQVFGSRTLLLNTNIWNVDALGFAMRWLCPSDDLPGGTGFPLQRESGSLPKIGGRPPSLVKEGRVMFLFTGSIAIPPVFSMVVLSNCGPRSNEAYNVFNEAKPHYEIELVGEQSISIMQLVLMNLLEAAWYQGWVSLLDEIDDSVTVLVGRMFS